ncbi:MAG: NADH-quinone oxidoreductase subunit I [Desulfobulbaceae bacterium]|nr:NADH-quinone oxidoreductase subunit I [Desulfobulbaceae bacterium]HIJ77695.1 NADH-quinone oxidoreductase subunit I [Deltaproteobacteria bacterium]
MIDYFKEIISGTWSLFVGMAITIRYFFQPVVTVQYPHETLPMPPRFRGHIDLVKDEESGQSKCIVCGMCQKACPSGCITLAGEKPEGGKGKVLTKYILDFTKCSLCGLCVESCKPEAIAFSRDYNLAGLNRNDYVFDLIKRMEERN